MERLSTWTLLVTLVLAALALPSAAPGAALLSDNEASQVIESHWNAHSSFGRWRVGQLSVIAGLMAGASDTDSAKGTISADGFEALQALAKAGLVSIAEDKGYESFRQGGNFTWGQYTEALSGVAKKILVTPTAKGETLGRTTGHPQTSDWLTLPVGKYRVSKIIRNEANKSSVYDYRIVMLTYDAQWEPTHREYSASQGRVLSDKRKGIVLVRHNPFESKWKVLAFDVTNADQDFTTGNVAKAVANIDILKDPVTSPRAVLPPPSQESPEPMAGPVQSVAGGQHLLLITVDGIDPNAIRNQVAKLFPSRTAYLFPVFKELAGDRATVTWLEWDGNPMRTGEVVEELSRRILRMMRDGAAQSRVIAAHSWGGVLGRCQVE